MPELWGRSARLEFGVPGETGVLIDTSDIAFPSSNPQITFNISKSLKSKNKATISIYNLNATNREIVSRAKGDTLFCNLEVGHGGDNFTIFKGTIQVGGSRWSGHEWITTFTAVDGLDLKKQKVNKTYPAGTDIKKIMTETLQGIGGKYKGLIKDLKSEVSQNGLTLSGSVPVIIDSLMNMMPSQDLEQTVQDEIVYVKPIDIPIDENNIPIISPSTGMIGAPEKTKKGVNFKALLQKGLAPGRAIEILSSNGEYDGFYIIQKAKLNGTLRGGKWEAACEGLATSKIQKVAERGVA